MSEKNIDLEHACELLTKLVEALQCINYLATDFPRYRNEMVTISRFVFSAIYKITGDVVVE